MPVNMRLLSRHEGPSVEDTPPSTRPSSAASNATSISGPHRSTSLDSLNTTSSTSEKPQCGEEHIPTRMIRTSPRVNSNAMQFVKVGPSNLYKVATEQIKRAEAVKAVRKSVLEEDEQEWQSTKASFISPSLDEGSDWQVNLDKWKSSRRKRNEDVLERVIEIKKYEQKEDNGRTRRKSKTFNEMREDTSRKGRRYNLVVHDNDNNDLADLGLSGTSRGGNEEEADAKDLENDNKDTKSDAGFCTGSDTGSDGVFAEDNISDTSSALGDKKEHHDSMLGVSSRCKDSETHENGQNLPSSPSPHLASLSPVVLQDTDEYTYDKAIEGYKQYAKSTVKKRTSSVSSSTSLTKDDEMKEEKLQVGGRSLGLVKESSLEERSSLLYGENTDAICGESGVLRREKSPRVEVYKRRSMFELRDIDRQEQKYTERKAVCVSSSLKNKVASFENLTDSSFKSKTVTAPRDTKFKEKLASFTQKEYSPVTSLRKSSPEKNLHFYEKLETFSNLESNHERLIPSNKSPPSVSSLKKRIASFEQRSLEDSSGYGRSSSMGFLNKDTKSESRLASSSSKLVSAVMKRSLSTPFIIDGTEEIEKTPHKETRERSRSCGLAPALLPEQLVRVVDTIPKEKPLIVHHSEQLTRNVPQKDFRIQGPHLPDPAHKVAPITPTLLINTSLTCDKTLMHESKLHEHSPLQGESSHSSLEGGGGLQYGDEDIDEIINRYEDIEDDEPHFYERASNMTSGVEEIHMKYESEENVYENINDDDHLYENIYEKVNEENASENQSFEPLSPPAVVDHYYQTVEEVNEDAVTKSGSLLLSANDNIHSPPPLPVVEVLDVTWAEETGSSPVPPSVPPPPPPPEDSSDEEEKVLLASSQPSASHITQDLKAKSESSPQNIKKEIWKKMSDFLGTVPRIESEPALHPPPDITELLRQERQMERELLEKSSYFRSSLEGKQSFGSDVTSGNSSFETTSGSLDEGMPFRNRYTWEDRLRDDDKKPGTVHEGNEDLEFHRKLAELELEMEKHDRNVIQRLKTPSQDSGQDGKSKNEEAHAIPPPLQYLGDSCGVNSPYSSSGKEAVSSVEERGKDKTQVPQMVLQEFYTAPSYRTTFKPEQELLVESASKSLTTQPKTSPSQYASLASPHPFHSSYSSDSSYQSEPVTQPQFSTESSFPEPFPRKKKLPAPPLQQQESSDSRTQSRLSRPETGDSGHKKPDGPFTLTQPLTKQSLLALSAIPKPRLTDSESWITKRKPDTGHKDYRKHWVMQEAEQRRIEQQERIDRSRPVFHQPGTYVNNRHSDLKSTLPTMSATHTHAPPQPSVSQPVQTEMSYSSSCPVNSSLKVIDPSRVNGSSKPNWMNHATTYQPTPPFVQRNENPLPESVIDTITQRVNNKNRNGSRNGGMNKCTYSKHSSESYHDYMNTANLHIPQSSSGLQYPGVPDALQQNHSSQGSTNGHEEQKLLSVSGKKKCSHCSEELGRGAAMIIESLRLFYHIPCFKCCVCGVQLGNGTSGADVRVRNHKLHCHNCYSNDEGMKFSKV